MQPELIICCGMSRSGSTVQYQIVKHIIESRDLGKGYGFPSQIPKRPQGISVVKSEPFRPELIPQTTRGKALLLSIHRDPRDVALSLLQFYTKRAEWQGANMPTWDDVLDYLKKAIDWHMAWVDTGAHSWKYEEKIAPSVSARFVYDMTLLMNVKLEPDEYASIIATFSRQIQQYRIGDLDRWMDTESSLLTRGHLGDGKTKWMTRMTFKQIQDVQQIAEQFMARWSYGFVRYDWG